MRSLDGFAGPVEVLSEDALCSDFVLAPDGWSVCPDFVDLDFIEPDFVDSEGPAVPPKDLLSRGTP